MKSLPGLPFLPHQAGTPSSQWVHTLNLTQPAALLGGRELQPEERTEDRGWVKQMSACNTGFCTSQEPACRTSRKMGIRQHRGKLHFPFRTFSRAHPEQPSHWVSVSRVPGTSPVLWGREWRSPSYHYLPSDREALDQSTRTPWELIKKAKSQPLPPDILTQKLCVQRRNL